MPRCKDCIHYKVCAWCFEADNCAFFETSADVVPRSEIIKVLSDLKKEIHDKAVYPNISGVDSYISLKKVDAILSEYMNDTEKRKK